MDTFESNYRISSFNELGAGFSWVSYFEGVHRHCGALDMGMWGMILHCDIVAGQSTLRDLTL